MDFSHSNFRFFYQGDFSILGIGLMIRAISTYFKLHDYDRFKCVLIGLPSAFGIIFSQIILLAMAIDRFLAVFRPRDYFTSENKVGHFYWTNIVSNIQRVCLKISNNYSKNRISCWKHPKNWFWVRSFEKTNVDLILLGMIYFLTLKIDFYNL